MLKLEMKFDKTTARRLVCHFLVAETLCFFTESYFYRHLKSHVWYTLHPGCFFVPNFSQALLSIFSIIVEISFRGYYLSIMVTIIRNESGHLFCQVLLLFHYTMGSTPRVDVDLFTQFLKTISFRLVDCRPHLSSAGFVCISPFYTISC